MSKIKIQTDEIKALAKAMNEANQDLQASFQKMSREIEQLSALWKGQAGKTSSQAIQKAIEAEKDRMQLFHNIIQLLQVDVAEGYEATENQNIKLAEQFK